MPTTWATFSHSALTAAPLRELPKPRPQRRLRLVAGRRHQHRRFIVDVLYLRNLFIGAINVCISCASTDSLVTLDGKRSAWVPVWKPWVCLIMARWHKLPPDIKGTTVSIHSSILAQLSDELPTPAARWQCPDAVLANVY
ncbi:unnamed protein product, partial [Ixodes pacificus]